MVGVDLDSTIVIVISDYGEVLGEGGCYYYGLDF